MRTSYHKVYSGLSQIFTVSSHKMVCLQYQQPLRGRLKVGTSVSHLSRLPVETSGVLNWLSLRDVFPARVTLCKNVNSSGSQPRVSLSQVLIVISVSPFYGLGTVSRWSTEYQLKVNGKSEEIQLKSALD